MYYTHPGYRTSIFGKNCAYYRIFTVSDTGFLSAGCPLCYSANSVKALKETWSTDL